MTEPPRASRLVPTVSGAPIGTVTLVYADRFRRRMRLSTDGGLRFLLDLPEAVELRDGQALVLDDGRIIAVRAAGEPVADLYSANLVQLAWHLGNRHLPTQILPGKLRILQDHVIEDMAEKLGARVERLLAPFQPEGGAYGHGRTHGHHHHHDPGGSA